MAKFQAATDRQNLLAEAQPAATAVDSTEFVVCFWHMIFNPLDTLKDTLQVKDPMLSPTFITDAKALYDNYLCDAINHGATDKRTNLELRVVREQVEGMNGVLKWISSERQFGDGLTKIGACQLLCDRLRHGAIKFTFDPGYTASRKKTAAQRDKSRNECATTSPNSISTPLRLHQQHVATADEDEMHVVAEGERCTGPDITSEGIDVDDVCGSVDEIHACEGHRLVPADEHPLESEKATEEPFFPENLQLSKSDDVFVEYLVAAEIQAPVYNMSPESYAAVVNSLVPDEAFGSKNFKMRGESYARASHAVRFWAFWLLRWQFGFWCGPTEALGFSWWKNKPELYASHRTWNSPTTNENSIVDTGTIRSMRTSHCRWNWISSTSESKSSCSRSAVEQACQRPFVGQGVGRDGRLPWDARVPHPIWPMLACDTGTSHSGQLPEDRWASCLQCLFTPCKNHQNIGTTFDEDVRQFFRRHGGRGGYMRTINSWEPGCFNFFLPLLLLRWLHSMHSCQPWAFDICILTTVCWPQFPSSQVRGSLTPTTSYAWQRTSRALVLLGRRLRSLRLGLALLPKPHLWLTSWLSFIYQNGPLKGIYPIFRHPQISYWWHIPFKTHSHPVSHIGAHSHPALSIDFTNPTNTPASTGRRESTGRRGCTGCTGCARCTGCAGTGAYRPTLPCAHQVIGVCFDMGSNTR